MDTKSLEILAKARSQLVETESVAVGVHSNLKQQNAQLNKMKEKIKDVNENLLFSNKLLNRFSIWKR